jgi:hypothetical protein
MENEALTFFDFVKGELRRFSDREDFTFDVAELARDFMSGLLVWRGREALSLYAFMTGEMDALCDNTYVEVPEECKKTVDELALPVELDALRQRYQNWKHFCDLRDMWTPDLRDQVRGAQTNKDLLDLGFTLREAKNVGVWQSVVQRAELKHDPDYQRWLKESPGHFVYKRAA